MGVIKNYFLITFRSVMNFSYLRLSQMNKILLNGLSLAFVNAYHSCAHIILLYEKLNST